MKLIFALGNFTKEYTDTRHNIGFYFVDRWLEQHNLELAEKSKMKAMMAKTVIDSETVIIAKPTTFYNLAGQSYRAICNFYNIQEKDCLIIHDDLALNLGVVRTRWGGSDAGNNGLKSIIEQGGSGSGRLRIGSSTAFRNKIQDDAKFVLGKITPQEQKILTDITPQIMQIIDDFIDQNFTITSVSI